jgi:hypothetical protein
MLPMFGTHRVFTQKRGMYQEHGRLLKILGELQQL